MMDVWDPFSEQIERATPRPWCNACAFVALVMLSAGGWAFSLWLALLLWSLA